MPRYSWQAVEQELAGRAGWHRRGREWRGPCPVTGLGKDTCWARPADYIADGVLVGCHKCQPWGRESREEHLDALAPNARRDPPPKPPRPRPPRPKREPFRPSPRILPIWQAGRAVTGTLGETYLRLRRCCWSQGPVPPSIRWLERDNPAFPDLRPIPPDHAAGVVLYAYRGVRDREIGGLQMEAIGPRGQRLLWEPGNSKRVSLAGSLFDGGRQRFEARWRGAEAPVFLVEGPTSALGAIWYLPVLQNGWNVVGTAGWAGFTTAALGDAPRAWVFPDGDAPSRRAAADLAALCREQRRGLRLETVPDGLDLLDLLLGSRPASRLPAVPTRPLTAGVARS